MLGHRARGTVLGHHAREFSGSHRAVIGRLVDAGAEGIVLGCTEIEMLIGASDRPVQLFPTTPLHAEAAVAASFESVDLQSGGTTTGSLWAPTLAE